VILAADVFTRAGLGQFGWRWLHILMGITWIGLLYYFNVVQVPAFAQYGDEARARNIAIDKVARKALWWFRWSAVATVITGLLITGTIDQFYGNDFGKRVDGVAISTGMLLGIIMFLNVWGVIWRKQKIVLANAKNILEGGQPDPNAAAAARVATMASRQNFVFSISMLWFMVYASHAIDPTHLASSAKLGVYWAITIILIVVLEVNALGLFPWKTAANQGLNMLYDGPGVRNPLIAAFGLWVVFMLMTQFFI
jgi:uncharacterized membrane protein